MVKTASGQKFEKLGCEDNDNTGKETVLIGDRNVLCY